MDKVASAVGSYFLYGCLVGGSGGSWLGIAERGTEGGNG